MRSSSSYNASSFDLVMNAQTAVNWEMDNEIARARPDSIEVEDYLYGTVNEFSTDALLWGAAMVEPYDKVVDPNDPSNFYTSVVDYQGQKTCGASGSATCAVNIYEWGQGTLGGSIDQTHMDYINAGAGQGAISVLEPMLNLQYFGILNNSYFALAEFDNGSLNGNTAKLWGNTVDMGGATNNVRPAFLALSLMNQSIIGPMYSCPITNNAIYNFAGNPENGSGPPPGMLELNNVPYLYAFCFQNGNNRSLVLVNTDLANSHTLAFSGTNTPSGAVVQRRYAPSSLDDMNETHSGTLTNKAQATVALSTTALSSPTSLTLPPYSVTALDYTAGGSQEAQTATPSISPAGGSYATPVSVTISDTTSGATIYYTTNGTAPTTSSAKYTGPITVSSTGTVQAIAEASGDSTSAVASAAYTITPVVATPAFSPGGGSYTGAQSITISDATSGAAIYYTTNGGTPTTSSTRYTGAITVSASETLQAVAVLAGSTNSKVASATYTIGSSSAGLPNFPSGFTTTMLKTNGTAEVTGGALQLTSGLLNQAGSAWYTAKVPINNFTSDFTFQLQNAVADGFTFTIQNAANGTAALGGDRSDLGYGGIGSSVAIKFDLYNNAGEGPDSTGTYVNGATPTMPASDLSSDGIDLHSGDTFHAHIVYDGNTLTLSLTDTNTGAVATRQFSINIPAAVGATTAYVGFTGATGGYFSTQQILNWTFSNSTIPPIVATPAFSPAGGTFATAQSVTITDSTKGATIYYTTDGSSPTNSSTVYQKAFAVSSTETIRAIAVASGFTNSDIASATYAIGASGNLPDYPSGMSSSMLALNGSALLENGGLWLTSGALMQAGSAWYSAKVPITTFNTSFTFQLLNATADGFTFTIQGDSAGTGTLGANRDGLGYAGINNSVALKFDLFDNSGEGPDSTGVYLNGAVPTVPASDLSSSGIDLHSGDVLQAQVVYNGTTLTLTLTDTKTKAVATREFTVDIPSTIGSDSAYVGFTGATGGFASTQEILNWTFSNVIPQSTAAVKTPASTSSPKASTATTSGVTKDVMTAAASPAAAVGISSSLLSTNGSAAVNSGAIQLTSGKSSQVGSAWYTVKIPVDHFSTDFNFRMLNATGNGLTFTLQNDNSGIWALGQSGDKLGSAGISNSFALRFNLDPDANKGSSATGVYLNGVEPAGVTLNLGSEGAKLQSGDVYHAHVTYDGDILSLTLTDTKTGVAFSQKVSVNIPAAVGGNTAYAGFTGGTGISETTHQILNWTLAKQ
jgi:hypothetical protein